MDAQTEGASQVWFQSKLPAGGVTGRGFLAWSWVLSRRPEHVLHVQTDMIILLKHCVHAAGHMPGLGVLWGGCTPLKSKPFRHAPVGWLSLPSAICCSVQSLLKPSSPCSAAYRYHQLTCTANVLPLCISM